MNLRNVSDSMQASGVKPKAKPPLAPEATPITATPSAAEAVDSVALSSASQRLQRSNQADFTVDEGKVAALQKAVDDGTYQIDDEALADKLIAHQADLLRVTKRGA